MTKGRWVLFRILYNIFIIGGNYFCSKITDSIRLKIIKKPENRFQIAFADTISVSIYKIPLYNLAGLIMGINIKQLLVVSVLYLVDNIPTGWLYGMVRDGIRDWIERKNSVITRD
jgi:hypothetical protein